jgi:hypothetical protein
MQHNSSSFYKADIDHINKTGGVIFTMLRNNFIDTLTKATNESFYHLYRGNKRSISRGLKLQCWEKYYQGQDTVVCPIPNCSINLCKNNFSSWQAGHIKSEHNGGLTNITNLKPICPSCNQAMGSMNWDEYIAGFENPKPHTVFL